MKNLRKVCYLFLTLVLICCKNEEKNESTNSEIKSEKKEKANSVQENKLDTSSVQIKQNNIVLETGDSYSIKYVLKETENNFDLSKDNIHVVIPNSSSNMKILDVFNVSDYNANRNLNAIVIHISDLTSSTTNNTVTHKLIADIKIPSIADLSKDHLKDGNLKVFILNEDVLDSIEKKVFMNCVKQEIGYSHKECNLFTGLLYEKDDDFINQKDDDEPILPRPREQEGDIITGG